MTLGVLRTGKRPLRSPLFFFCCRWILILTLTICVAVSAECQTQLALQLRDEGDHLGAALDFRRYAIGKDRAEAASYYWAAAAEYKEAGDYARTEKLLDLAEKAGPESKWPILLLRGEAAYGLRRWEESAFYFENTAEGANHPDPVRYALRKATAAKIKAGRPDEALATLMQSPASEEEALAAIQLYRSGRGRSPTLGATFGILPGFGYFYSGEWANGFRSLLLNSLFIFGMVHTAENEQWGAFAIITFFELTWYSGSIYGGIDAAHRYNRRRLDSCVNAVVGGASWQPDYSLLPTVSLKFSF